MLQSPWARKITIVSFLALTAILAWQAASIPKGLDPLDYLSSSSIAYQYVSNIRTLFGASADSITMASIGRDDRRGSNDDTTAQASITSFSSIRETILSGTIPKSAGDNIAGVLPPFESPLLQNLISMTGGSNGTLASALDVAGSLDDVTSALEQAHASVPSDPVLAQSVFLFISLSRPDMQQDVRFKRIKDGAGMVLHEPTLHESAASLNVTAMMQGQYAISAWRSRIAV